MVGTVGLSLSINLNDLCKDVWRLFWDAKDRSVDLKAFEQAFDRQWRKSQGLALILESNGSPSGLDFSKMSECQLEGLQSSIRDAEDYWRQFVNVLEKYQQSSRWGKVTKPVKWTARDKIKAEKIFGHLEKVNKDIKDEIDMFIGWFTEKKPSAASTLEGNTNAQNTGLAISTRLRRTWRETIPHDRTLLKEAKQVNLPLSGTKDGLQPALSKAVYDTLRNVLVEHRYYTSHDAEVETRAIQLAMFLSLARPTEMKVPHCIGTYRADSNSSYGFIFDTADLDSRNQAVADNSRTSLKSALSHFTNLRTTLLKPEEAAPNLDDHAVGSAASGIFRLSKFGDPDFLTHPKEYPSMSQRLKIASSIAQTVYEILLVDWVHQNIRSSNIWFNVYLDTMSGPAAANHPQDFHVSSYTVSAPYLFNFEFARPLGKYSDPNRMTRQDRIDKLSRHPDRQSAQGRVPHNKIHDIYSLGVVLMEIGMGRDANELLGFFKKINVPEPADLAEKIRLQFISGSAAMLPERMGDRFARVVARCLTSDFNPDEGEDGSEEDFSVLRAFRSLVVEELARISDNV